jgi:hypothetical protein
MSSDGRARSGVDLDALADYTAGVLDGAGAAAVADLIATDVRWARAYSSLVAADAVVRADLHAAAAHQPSMPVDVAARIDAALAAEAAPTRGVVISLDAARARRRKIVTGVAAAAAAVVAVFGGLSLVPNMMSARDSAEAPAAGRADTGGEMGAPMMPSAPAPASAGAPVVLVSGRDYAPDTLRGLGLFLAEPRSDAASKSVAPAPPQALDAAGGALAGLVAPASLDTCLDAITSVHPGVVQLVDYATYLGEPALIVLVGQGQTSTAVAAGPDCGVAGAAIIAAVPA